MVNALFHLHTLYAFYHYNNCTLFVINTHWTKISQYENAQRLLTSLVSEMTSGPQFSAVVSLLGEETKDVCILNGLYRARVRHTSRTSMGHGAVAWWELIYSQRKGFLSGRSKSWRTQVSRQCLRNLFPSVAQRRPVHSKAGRGRRILVQ